MNRLLFVLWFLSFSLSAQQISVVDSYTQEVLEEAIVTVVETGKTHITNNLGVVVLDDLQRKTVIEIKHKDYNTLQVSYKNIKRNVVLLEPKSEGLESIVLSVSRAAEKKQQIPEQIEMVVKKDIENISPQTSADLLASIPGVRVQKSQLGGGSPVIRGMESNRVLLVVDGVRMNNAIYRSGHLQNSISVSPFALERTEVVFGPASVTYGSDALGGVVHYYTKRLHYSTDLDLENKLFYRHSTVNNEHSMSFSSQVSHQKWASFTNVSYGSFGDLKMGINRLHGYESWGKVDEYSQNTDNYYKALSTDNSDVNIQKNTGYHQLDMLQKLMFPLHKNIDLVLNGQFSTTSDVPNFGKLNDYKNGNLKFAEWRYGPQQRLLVSAQARFNNYKSIFKNGAITLAYQNVLESRINRVLGSLDRTSRFENVDVYSLNSDFSIVLDKLKNQKLFYGVELVHNKVNSTAKGETLAVLGNQVIGVSNNYAVDTRYPDAGSTYSSAAAYTSYRYKFNKKHVLKAGLRLTSTLLKSDWAENVSVNIPDNELMLSNTALTGSLGYIFKPKPTDRISFVLSKGFRSPNVDDIGKIRSKSGKLTVPNTQLKPEHLYSTEIGFSKEMLKQKAHIGTSVYYTLLDHYIGRATSSEYGKIINYDGETYEDDGILANTNLGQAIIYGATVNGSYTFLTDIKFHTGLTYTKGEMYKSGQPLSSIPPLFGNVSIGIFKSKYDVSLDYRFSFAKELRDYNLIEGIDNVEETPNEEGVPKWSVLNLNTNYHFTEDFRFQFQVQNILDVHYKEFASSISAPGRNLVAAVAYSF